MRLMLVDEDRLFGTALVKHLTGEGYVVDWIPSARESDPTPVCEGHECLLLGLKRWDVGGERLLRSMQASLARVPNLVFSDQPAAAHRVALLDLGADDILCKPVDLQEVSARIRAVTRRNSKRDAGVNEFRHGPLTIDPAQRIAFWHGDPVSVTKKEFRLLEALVRNRGQILSRARLEERLYGWDDEIDSNAVEVFVHHLRRKFSRRLIVTHRGVGYQLGEPRSLESATPERTPAPAWAVSS
jgi:DNA-binding response OmpR family regulator